MSKREMRRVKWAVFSLFLLIVAWILLVIVTDPFLWVLVLGIHGVIFGCMIYNLMMNLLGGD